MLYQNKVKPRKTLDTEWTEGTKQYTHRRARVHLDTYAHGLENVKYSIGYKWSGKTVCWDKNMILNFCL